MICKKDLDYLFRPRDEQRMNFTEKTFDILFDLSMNDYFPVVYLTTLSRASFKVGRYRETGSDNDFMIDIRNEFTVEFLIEQIKNYVSILNNPAEAGKITSR